MLEPYAANWTQPFISLAVPKFWWLGGLVVRALDSRLYGDEFDSRPPRIVLGWVTVCGRANHLSISTSHPGKLSLLPVVGWEMSTIQSVVML